jgi:hypothetical protein
VTRFTAGTAVLLLTASTALAQSPPVDVLVDGSGSTRGFFATGAMPRLVDGLRAEGATRVLTFRHRAEGGRVSGGLVPFEAAPAEVGNVTLLWRGLSEHLRIARPGTIVAMVTDNVQDAGGLPSEQRDVSDFYDALLNDGRLKQVYVLPLRLSFEGTLYGRSGAGSIGSYVGERGLVVYLIGVEIEDDSTMREAARSIARRIGAEPVRMKPYTTAPVIVQVDTARSREVAAAQVGCPSIPLAPDPADTLLFVGTKPVNHGRKFGGVFVVRLRSELEGVTLSRPRVAAMLAEEFQLTDFDPAGQPEVRVNPPRLETQFAPGDSEEIRVAVCFPEGVRFDPFGASFFRLATSSRRTGRFEGGVRVMLQVPRADLRLADVVRDEYSVSDPAFFTSTSPDLHRRVYNLEDAFRRAAPLEVRVEAPVDRRLRFDVLYPVSPLLALLGLVGAFLLLIALLAWLFLHTHPFLLREEGEGRYALRPPAGRRPRLRPDALDDYGETSDQPEERGTPIRLGLVRAYGIRIDGRPAASLRRGLAGPVVRAGPGFQVNGRTRVSLGSGGGLFELQHAERGGGSRRRSATVPRESGALLDPALDP